jgi:ApaG protein
MIETPVGSMRGNYEMIADDGTRFEAPIPPFSLATPTSLH